MDALASVLTTDNSAVPEATFVHDDHIEQSPVLYARELMAKVLPAPVASQSASFRIPQDQYHAVLLSLEPLQQLWDFAARTGRLHDFKTVSGLVKLMVDMPDKCIMRALFHGPGGSGKTFCMTNVVIPVYKRYCPRGIRTAASQNSAARLIGGSTFHFMSVLTRGSVMGMRQPVDKRMRRLMALWSILLMFLVDEVSLTDPQLLAVVNANAGWGRWKPHNLEQNDFVEQTFGNIMLQLLLGDFMQLNPVRAYSLIETFLEGTELVVPRVLAYENCSPEERRRQQDLDRKGFRIFDKLSQNVVLFRGSYRFKPGDPLAELLAIMRKPGGCKLPQKLRDLIESRFSNHSSGDKRLSQTYVPPGVDGPKGFFAIGFHSAINWEQVSRLQQLWAAHAAALSSGPVAYQNTRHGAPQLLSWSFPPAAARRKTSAIMEVFDAPGIAARLKSYLQDVGQLLFYTQAVDIPHAAAYKSRRSVFEQALGVANMASATAGLMSVFPFFHGMRMKLTKKIMAPELVQEAPGEVVGVRFHKDEAFGERVPASQPGPEHPCWSRGWVLLDHLPEFLEFRLDGSSEDYTGLGKPGVLHLQPTHDTWELKYKLRMDIDHPGSVRMPRKIERVPVAMTRCQLLAAPEPVGTYQNMQGKTVRTADGKPLGHTIDLKKPPYFTDSEYKQHLHMILGRATSLAFSLFVNFPMDENGNPDWHWFEEGPPDYLVHFMQELKNRHAKTQPIIEAVRQRLDVFLDGNTCQKLTRILKQTRTSYMMQGHGIPLVRTLRTLLFVRNIVSQASKRFVLMTARNQSSAPCRSPPLCLPKLHRQIDLQARSSLISQKRGKFKSNAEGVVIQLKYCACRRSPGCAKPSRRLHSHP